MENVKLEKKNKIAYVTIDRPKVLNALNMATMGELQEVFTDLAADREIRVVILTGGGAAHRVGPRGGSIAFTKLP